MHMTVQSLPTLCFERQVKKRLLNGWLPCKDLTPQIQVSGFRGISVQASDAGVLPASKADKKAHWKRNAKSTSFVDSLSVSVAAGKGGDGCVSFSRAKYVQYGPPSGGNGGSGGSVYVRAVAGMRSLARTSTRVIAGDGAHGKGDWQTGRAGRDVVLSVPIGTVVTVSPHVEANDEEVEPQVLLRKEYEEDLLARLSRHNRLRSSTLSSAREVNEQSDPQSSMTSSDVADTPAIEVEKDEFSVDVKSDGVGNPPECRLNACNEDQDDELHVDRYVDPPAEESIMNEAQPADPSVFLEEAESQKEYMTDEELTLQAMEAQERRDILNSVWKQYPGMGGTAEGAATAGVGSGDIFDQKSFHLAEERYAIALKRERAAQVAMDTRTWDFSTPTPDDSPGELVASGGRGGAGNPFFLTGDIRSPKFATRGEAGQRVKVDLEFKSPADIGFVGLPNAGKSSLLRALTGATKNTAQVGGWEFTTLSPNLGVLRIDEDGHLIGTGTDPIFDSSTPDDEASLLDASSQATSSGSESLRSQNEARFTIADLPGLIEGASMNRGLGHTFLKHAERCDALVCVLDVGPTRTTPWQDLAILKNELERYKTGLSAKIAFVIANKCDALGPAAPTTSIPGAEAQMGRLSVKDAQAKLSTLRQEAARLSSNPARPLQVVPISAMWRQGLKEVGAAIKKLPRKGDQNNSAI
ncbi:unnamed protein product [Sympodiomycopsis kandeliae]